MILILLFKILKSLHSFGYDKKIIIIRNSTLFKKDGRKKSLTQAQEKFLSYLNENYNIIQEQNIIVFVEEQIDKNVVFEQIDKYGIICEINQLKPNELIPRLITVAKMYDVTLENDIANYLIESCGTDLRNLINNELRKLIEYISKDSIITKNDINKLCIKTIR